jgi:predicted secreted protein with PEFG-CTERM motif
MQRPPTNRFFAYALILTLVGSLFSVVLPASQQSYASHENITVNISGDEVTEIYDPGDSVVIEGTIEDVLENEDITIRVRDPSGSLDHTESNIEPDEDDGYFDFLYEIPNNADGGAWEIEVDYDGEKVYSYFMVEYDEDVVAVIIVELDATAGIYEAGDEVTIEGAVDDVDANEEFVEIIVFDPTSDEIVDEDEVVLGEGGLGNDEFEFSFDLENDAGHGRYAVKVTYAGNQEGAALFEIEDEDEGSVDEESNAVTSDTDGNLAAEIDEEIYAQGGTVVITGEIDNYDSADNEELSISIRDPDDLEIEAEDDADVEDNGDFEFEYDVDGNADVGDYTITIAYDGDEVELIFEVEEGEDGGSSSDALTVRLDKASYLAGETITVTGTVEDVADPEDGEMVSILLYDPDNRVILAPGSSKYVTPSSSGAYSATVAIPSDLDEDEDYTVRVSYLDETVEASFEITGVSDTPSDEITVVTDGDEYGIGQTVEISGNVPATMIVSGEPLVIRINKPDGNPCRIDQVNVPASGSYSYEMVLGGTCGVAGEYEIEVTYGGEEGSTTFELTGSSASEYSLVVEGDTYSVEYEMSGGSINSMFVRPAENKLVITVDAEEEGQLTVVLPREVIDAVEDGEDISYLVTIEDESGNTSTVEIEESENTDNARTLVIDYAAGTGRIEIAGTQVVPEFGAIAAVIMAVAIVGIIVATARYNNKLSLVGQ